MIRRRTGPATLAISRNALRLLRPTVYCSPSPRAGVRRDLRRSAYRGAGSARNRVARADCLPSDNPPSGSGSGEPEKGCSSAHPGSRAGCGTPNRCSLGMIATRWQRSRGRRGDHERARQTLPCISPPDDEIACNARKAHLLHRDRRRRPTAMRQANRFRRRPATTQAQPHRNHERRPGSTDIDCAAT